MQNITTWQSKCFQGVISVMFTLLTNVLLRLFPKENLSLVPHAVFSTFPNIKPVNLFPNVMFPKHNADLLPNVMLSKLPNVVFSRIQQHVSKCNDILNIMLNIFLNIILNLLSNAVFHMFQNQMFFSRCNVQYLV